MITKFRYMICSALLKPTSSDLTLETHSVIKMFTIEFWLKGIIQDTYGPFWCVGRVDSTPDKAKAGHYTLDEANAVIRIWNVNAKPVKIVAEPVDNVSIQGIDLE